MAWPASKIETLVTMWADGYSADRIACELGCSRDAVLGFAWRNRDRCPGRGAGRHPAPDKGKRHKPPPRRRWVPPLRVAPRILPRKPETNIRAQAPTDKASLYLMLRRAVLNTGGHL